ncbi:DUF3572 domain-containing protein [Cochlodiniinecator piscidefendens]|uniref:DUF3572 domain-containing protein n=1 Tax=Cochlodiniinecator piscidefendens TaxID=2715756 RepID=UPI00140C3802|nr:DUF3572 domain-containing protein [Cochlodiniinecator piscidefendens]
MKREIAETEAIKILGWLIANDELLPIFLGASGSSEADLRQGMADPAFLGSVLDFIVMDDAWIVSCCDDLGISYETPMHARQALPGGGQVHWT